MVGFTRVFFLLCFAFCIILLMWTTKNDLKEYGTPAHAILLNKILFNEGKNTGCDHHYILSSCNWMPKTVQKCLSWQFLRKQFIRTRLSIRHRKQQSNSLAEGKNDSLLTSFKCHSKTVRYKKVQKRMANGY